MSIVDRAYLAVIMFLMVFVLWFSFSLAGKAEPSFDNVADAVELHPVPPYLEGGQITLKTRAGISEATSKDYAIVLRKNLSKYKKCPSSCLAEAKKACSKEAVPTKCEASVIEKIVDRYVETPEVEEKPVAYNRLIAHFGIGYNGVEAVPVDTGTGVVVQQKQVPIVGATYMRAMDSGFSFGVTAFSNNSYTGSVGIDF
jgi:hypothetical protein